MTNPEEISDSFVSPESYSESSFYPEEALELRETLSESFVALLHNPSNIERSPTSLQSPESQKNKQTSRQQQTLPHSSSPPSSEMFGLKEFVENRYPYTLGEKIAEGGMGYIHTAIDLKMRRRVVMKIAKTPESNTGESHEELARFVTEARTTGILEHPNIMPVHDLGIDPEGRYFFTMKQIHGKSLGDKVKQLQNTEDPEWRLGAILQLFLKICDAISFAHSQGVLHRDLKPDNIMLGDHGEVLVLDWGLAKFRSTERRSPQKMKRISTKPQKEKDLKSTNKSALALEGAESIGERKGYHTLSGMVLGTPEYMPPEQAKGLTDQVDERSDIYALGVILYEMLTLDIPYKGATFEDVLVKVCTESPIRPSEQLKNRQKANLKTSISRIPPELESIIMTCMEEKREHRYQTVKRLSKDILHFITEEPVSVYKDAVHRRLFKWSKRHPLLLGVSISGILIGLVLFVVIVAYNQKNTLLQNQKLQKELELTRESEKSTLLERQKNQALLENLQLEQSRIQEERKQFQAMTPYIKGLEMMERRLYRQARESFQDSIEADSSFASSYIQLAKCHTQLGFFLDAVENLKKGIQLLSEKKNFKSMVQPYFMLGQLYLDHLNDQNLAKDYFKKAKELDPESPYGQLGQAMYLFKIDQLTDSLNLVEDVLKNFNYFWEAYYLKACIYSQKNYYDSEKTNNPHYDLTKAKEACHKALEISGSPHSVHFKLHQLYFIEKNYEKALLHLDRAIESFPLAPYYHYSQASIFFSIERYEDALEAIRETFERLQARNKSSDEYRFTEYRCLCLQTEIYLAQKNLSKAESSISRLFNNSYITTSLYVLRGRVYELGEKYEKAYADYLKSQEVLGLLYYLALHQKQNTLESEGLPHLEKFKSKLQDSPLINLIESILKQNKEERDQWIATFQDTLKKQSKDNE
jgi:serine/threonine protein kinase